MVPDVVFEWVMTEREIHMEILHDLDKFLVTKEINRPVILFLDGASPHISLDALKFCKEKNNRITSSPVKDVVAQAKLIARTKYNPKEESKKSE